MRLLFFLLLLCMGCTFEVEPDETQNPISEVAGYWEGTITGNSRPVQARLHLGMSGTVDGTYTLNTGTVHFVVGSFDHSHDSQGRLVLGIRAAVGTLGTADWVALLSHPDSLWLSWHNENQYLMTRASPFPRLE